MHIDVLRCEKLGRARAINDNFCNVYQGPGHGDPNHHGQRVPAKLAPAQEKHGRQDNDSQYEAVAELGYQRKKVGRIGATQRLVDEKEELCVCAHGRSGGLVTDDEPAKIADVGFLNVSKTGLVHPIANNGFGVCIPKGPHVDGKQGSDNVSALFIVN